VIENRNLNLDTRAGSQDKKTQDFSGNVRWTPNENWTVSADLQYIKSTAKVYSMTAFTGADIPTTIAFDFSGDDPSMTMTPTNSAQSLTNKNAYWWAAAMDHIEDNDADEWATRADVEYTFTDSDFLKSLRVGGRYTDRNATTRQSTYNWSILSAQYWQPGNAVYLNQTGYPGGPQNTALPDQTTLVNFNNFFRGNVASPGAGFWLPSASLVQNGTANAYNYLKSTLSNTWGWRPLSDDYSTNPGGINDQTEETIAGYGLLRFGMDQSPLGHFDGNIGVRVVRTETTAVGTPITVGAPTSSPTLCVVGTPITTGARAGQTVNATDCANYAAAFAFAGGQITQPTTGSNSYTDVLPSLNLRFFLKDNLQLRLAAAKAIVRPTFSQLNPYVSLGYSFDSVTGIATGVGVDGRTTGFTGSAGNPDLKPTRSNQFDASLEYYFGRSNSLTFAAFYKDISNYIYAGVTERTFTSNGTTLTFDVTQQTNGSHGKIKGFEIGYTQFFDMLPGALGGLGFSGNFTYVDSSGGKNTAVNVFDANQTGNAGMELPLEGLSKTSYNAALVYEKYGISARAAYNWRSSYLLTTSAANINYPVWSESYGQLDASILYSINKHVKVGMQGYNLLNSRTFLDVGDPDLKPRYSWTDTDRRFAFLVRTLF
jgi:TonB-dependent receptor